MLAEFFITIVGEGGAPGRSFPLQSEAGQPPTGSWLVWRSEWYQVVDVVASPGGDARPRPPWIFCRRAIPPKHVLELHGAVLTPPTPSAPSSERRVLQLSPEDDATTLVDEPRTLEHTVNAAEL